MPLVNVCIIILCLQAGFNFVNGCVVSKKTFDLRFSSIAEQNNYKYHWFIESEVNSGTVENGKLQCKLRLI